MTTPVSLQQTLQNAGDKGTERTTRDAGSGDPFMAMLAGQLSIMGTQAASPYSLAQAAPGSSLLEQSSLVQSVLTQSVQAQSAQDQSAQGPSATSPMAPMDAALAGVLPLMNVTPVPASAALTQPAPASTALSGGNGKTGVAADSDPVPGISPPAISTPDNTPSAGLLAAQGGKDVVSASAATQTRSGNEADPVSTRAFAMLQAAASEGLSARHASQDKQPGAAQAAGQTTPPFLMLAPAQGTTTTGHVQATLETPVASARWHDDLSQSVAWLSSRGSDSVELHLNPRHLGPLDVQITINGDQATAQFASSHASVRDAVEQSLPRLREMLLASGIMLGNATVSDQGGQPWQRSSSDADQRRPDQLRSGRDAAQDTPISGATAGMRPLRLGGVDTFV